MNFEGLNLEPSRPWRVMSFNFWTDHPRHFAWRDRREGAAAVVARHRPDLLGGQELLAGMIADLATRLPDYAWFGVGRDDGACRGEFNPIFYRRDRFDLRDGGTFWLAPEPDRPGARGWGAACPRIVTWARFADRESRGDGAEIVHLNTHLDHQSVRARRQGAALLVKRAGELAAATGTTAAAVVVLTGDFNGGEFSAAYTTLTTPRSGLSDARTCAEAPPEGPRRTWRGLWGSGLGAARLDYVFVGTGVRVLRHAVLDDRGTGGRLVSDHRPVWVEAVSEREG